MNYFTSLIVCTLASTMVFCQTYKPADTEVWEPVPPVVDPGTSSNAPSDAIVLFDGSNFNEWEHLNGNPVKWNLEDGAMTVVRRTGGIRTKKKFGSIQLHIEWRTPSEVTGEGQGRGNSGVFLQEIYEIQVLDSYQNSTYVNGQAGSVYKQSIPLVNASRPPGVWQTYDIIYHTPVFKNDGSFEVPPTVTVLHNGVLIQDHFKLLGTTENVGHPKVIPHQNGSIMLQDHSDPVSYRNIWIRELD